MMHKLEVEITLAKNAWEQVEKYSDYLKILLCAKSVQYSEWSNECDSELKSKLKQSAGIYHFFRKENESITSLYVGKAGFGKNGHWSLYKRISQHFQPSQKNTLIGKVAKANGTTPEDAKSCLNDKEVYLQWLILCSNLPCIEQELIWIECFFKSILKPKYTDA